MAEDAEDELEDAAQGRQDAVSERLRRVKRKKVVSPGSVEGPWRSVYESRPAECAALL